MAPQKLIHRAPDILARDPIGAVQDGAGSLHRVQDFLLIELGVEEDDPGGVDQPALDGARASLRPGKDKPTCHVPIALGAQPHKILILERLTQAAQPRLHHDEIGDPEHRIIL